jgi:hypothetical protein
MISNRIPAAVDPTRRRLLGWSLAGLLPSWFTHAATLPAAETSALGGEGKRLALLIGNRFYPDPHDLPPIHKNVRDLQQVLEQRGFSVTSTVDLGLADLRRVIAEFAVKVAKAPPEAPVFFYFSGHGMQVDAENLLLGAGNSPAARESVLLNSSLHFTRDVLDVLPRRPHGLTMTVLDACRTDLRNSLANGDGFNQVEAPPGCMIVFSTAAGRPAIAPAVETQKTFYTASLVKVLGSASDDITFGDMFRLVKTDVQQTMLNHQVPAIRQMAQEPFIAENVRGRFPLAAQSVGRMDAPVLVDAEESAFWKELQDCAWPADIIRLARSYMERFPNSTLLGSASVALEGATEAEKAMRRKDVRLFKSAFFPTSENPTLWDELRKAARGDKDAAARIARLYRVGDQEIAPDPNRYQGWLQYAAALGNGIAAYELALHYRSTEQPLLAAQFEARARELAYTPPPTLDHSRK